MSVKTYNANSVCQIVKNVIEANDALCLDDADDRAVLILGIIAEMYGDIGHIYEYATGRYIRPATLREALQSIQSGAEGAFDLEGTTVYVADIPSEALGVVSNV